MKTQLFLATALLLASRGALPAAEVTGKLVNPNQQFGQDANYKLTGNTTFGWMTGTQAGDFDLNGHAFIVETGGGNRTVFSGVIAGMGSVEWRGGSVPQVAPSVLTGRAPNTFKGSFTLVNGVLDLDKPTGVDAIPGNLLIGAKGDAMVKLNRAHQINDAAQVTLGGTGVSSLDLQGHDEKFASLTLATHGVISLGTNPAALLIGDSSGRPWNLAKTLTIRGFKPGRDMVAFGKAANGLSAAQLARVGFASPAGRPEGLYTATMGANGQLAPGTVVKAAQPPFDVSADAGAARKKLYDVPGLTALSATDSPLKDGMTVVFFGDSITWQNGFVGLLDKTLKSGEGAKGRAVKLVNRGINGGGVLQIRDGSTNSAYPGSSAQKSFATVIAAEKADVAMVFIGINDVWWRKTEPAVFEQALHELHAAAKANRTRLVLATLTIRGELPDGKNSDDAKIEQFAEITRKVAAATGATLVDLRRAYLAYLQNHNAELRVDGTLYFVPAGVLTYDGVHPSGRGNELLANLISDGIVRALALGKAAAVPGPLKPGAPFDYSKHAFQPKSWEKRGLSLQLIPWVGTNVTFLTTNADLDPDLMAKWVSRLDAGWQLYADLTGRNPNPFRQFEGKVTIAAVPGYDLTCGAGCGYVGATGIELAMFYDHNYPALKTHPEAMPHYVFYEMGRNHYTFGDRHSCFITGFAVFMRYVCMDALRCEDTDARTRKVIESVEPLLATSGLSFLDLFTMATGVGEKVSRIRDANGKRVDPSDQPVRYATAMLRLRRENGGDAWVKRFFHALASAPTSKPDTKDGALNQGWYWLLCANVAAQKDLSPVFAGEWRLPISEATRTALGKIDWKKEGLTMKEVAAAVLPVWKNSGPSASAAAPEAAVPLVPQPPVDPDPNGVLLKPIPDRLVVLTFDDAPVSHATVVAPILKEMGFGGSIYVCDFDSFKTRKDWYLTYRQMNAMHADGLEIGNHSLGHQSGYEPMLAMEDQVLAHGGPRMTTLCWPIYNVNWNDCPKLSAHGYTFGRGGHERPYRPTVDNPFDAPSFSMSDGISMENFTKKVQQACQGRVVVLTFHGVPDLEHPPVSLKPATFRAMMQYLKDNNYQCIALRDVAKYIDPVKAAGLPRTVSDAKGAPPFASIKDEKPFVTPPGNDILEFRFPGLPPANVSKTSIRLTVPNAADVTALVPNIKVSPDATVAPATGTVRDFSKPQTYTVAARDGSTKSYIVTVSKTAISDAKDLLTFTLPGVFSNAVSGNRIAVSVPANTAVTALAPTFTLSPLATAVPPSGTTRDFTRQQSYTITAQDGSAHVCTVMVVKISKPNAFAWSKAEGGNWSEAARWSDNLGSSSTPHVAGQPDYVLSFNQGGARAVTNDLSAGFLLNQLVLGDRSGGLVVSGHGVTFTKEIANNLPPVVLAGKCQRVDINVPLNLQEDLTVNTSPDKDPNCFISFNGVISGPRSLTLKSSGDANVAGINFHDVHFGILQINNANTYTGGTFINGGKINVRRTGGLGTGPITLDKFGTLSTEANLANPVVINQGALFCCALGGPVTLNGIAGFISQCSISGGMSGPGGFTMYGANGTYLNMVPGGTVTLHGTNTYTGPTTIFPATLIVKKAAGLYNGDAAKWTPANLTIHKAATLRLNVGGPGEFTGEHVGTLLGNLTRSVNDNGLMGGSFVSLDTANATEPVTISANIGDSKGPGGGSFLLRKCGPGTLRLSGNNTHAGQTILESGTLMISSLNNFTERARQASSSLGVPMDIEAGEIVIGEEGKDGDCALIYTGTGESSDRVMNFAGKKSTVTFDQSGTGLLKLTSDLLISGYGHSKTIALKGDTAGVGEIAGAIADPHDRVGKATTTVIKFGSGQWTLSGTNTYTGPTTVTQGTLALAHARSLSADSEVSIARGAELELTFKGQMSLRKLTLAGMLQPPGIYTATNAPGFLKGNGTLAVQP
ncbi:MAG: hypothetical protein RL514_2676 [Verrucomicrobiota bacterium]